MGRLAHLRGQCGLSKPSRCVGSTFFLCCVQAHPFWEAGTVVEMSSSTPDVIVPTEAEVNSAVQVGVRFRWERQRLKHSNYCCSELRNVTMPMHHGCGVVQGRHQSALMSKQPTLLVFAIWLARCLFCSTWYPVLYLLCTIGERTSVGKSVP